MIPLPLGKRSHIKTICAFVVDSWVGGAIELRSAKIAGKKDCFFVYASFQDRGLVAILGEENLDQARSVARELSNFLGVP
ncbi:MAG: hypothetical protein ACK4QL_10805 [Pseudanabaenaceae cyanobacterium]